MPADVALVSIRCLGHGGSMLLSEAILEGWKMCNHCHLFICPSCTEAFEAEKGGACPGSQATERHTMDLVEIPTDEVLLFVQRAIEAPQLGPLVYDVFFRGRSVQVDPLGTAVHPPVERRTPPDDPLAVLRREDWKRYGVVMVKRRRGRYVTWGPVN